MADRKRWDYAVVGCSLAHAALLITYIAKPDALAAVTIWPFWVPATLCLLPAVVSIRKARWKSRVWLLVAWLLTWLVVGDEPVGIARTVVPSGEPGLRVVSLNTAGLSEAAMEVIALKPDVVLLQESMGVDDIERLRLALGAEWSKVVGVDASILARAPLEAVILPAGTMNFVAAWVELPKRTLVVSLRLQPPVFRLDYWNPSCWSAYADNKRARRQELAALVRFIAETAGGEPVIIGGDFNTPPDDTVTGPLKQLAYDAFRLSGRGWGATAVNDFPMVRIDQIWASEVWDPSCAYSKKTKHSDHQMAIAEFRTPRQTL